MANPQPTTSLRNLPTGVSRHGYHKDRYRAFVTLGKVQLWLGAFDCPYEAGRVAYHARCILHDSPRHYDWGPEVWDWL